VAEGWGTTTALLVIGVAIASAAAFGLWRRRTDGRLGTARPLRAAERLLPGQIGTNLGNRATLLQFSSAYCGSCVATRRTLADVAAGVDGVVHVEVDAESRLDLVRRLNVRRTPTVLVLDRDGFVVSRGAGTPRRVDVIAAIGAV
jgi:thiol-disulfide isomerase/thioredoxin